MRPCLGEGCLHSAENARTQTSAWPVPSCSSALCSEGPFPTGLLQNATHPVFLCPFRPIVFPWDMNVHCYITFLFFPVSPRGREAPGGQGCLLLSPQTPVSGPALCTAGAQSNIHRMDEKLHLKDTDMPTTLFSDMLEEEFLPKGGGIEAALKSIRQISYGAGRK